MRSHDLAPRSRTSSNLAPPRSRTAAAAAASSLPRRPPNPLSARRSRSVGRSVGQRRQPQSVKRLGRRDQTADRVSNANRRTGTPASGQTRRRQPSSRPAGQPASMTGGDSKSLTRKDASPSSSSSSSTTSTSVTGNASRPPVHDGRPASLRRGRPPSLSQHSVSQHSASE